MNNNHRQGDKSNRLPGKLLDICKKKIGSIRAVSLILGLPLLYTVMFASCQPADIALTGISLDKTTLITLIGKTTQFTLSRVPANTAEAIPSVIWKSSNPSVASIDNSGLMTTLAKGDTIITATAISNNTINAKVDVTIEPLFYIPDDNFRAALKEKNENWFTLIDGVDGLKIEDPVVTTYNDIIAVSSKNISSLKGIEYFVALTRLYCYNNNLVNLDVSKNVALNQLWCYNNNLVNLDVGKNVALTNLIVHNNRLSNLDLSKNVALTYLSCSNNNLNSLDISNNVALTFLACYNNNLMNLDMNKNVALMQVAIDGNKLTNLDMSKNVALKQLWCYNNLLTNLDISGMRSVISLNIITGGAAWHSNNSGLRKIKVNSTIATTGELKYIQDVLGNNVQIETDN